MPYPFPLLRNKLERAVTVSTVADPAGEWRGQLPFPLLRIRLERAVTVSTVADPAGADS